MMSVMGTGKVRAVIASAFVIALVARLVIWVYSRARS